MREVTALPGTSGQGVHSSASRGGVGQTSHDRQHGVAQRADQTNQHFTPQENPPRRAHLTAWWTATPRVIWRRSHMGPRISLVRLHEAGSSLGCSGHRAARAGRDAASEHVDPRDGRCGVPAHGDDRVPTARPGYRGRDRPPSHRHHPVSCGSRLRRGSRPRGSRRRRRRRPRRTVATSGCSPRTGCGAASSPSPRAPRAQPPATMRTP